MSRAGDIFVVAAAGAVGAALVAGFTHAWPERRAAEAPGFSYERPQISALCGPSHLMLRAYEAQRGLTPIWSGIAAGERIALGPDGQPIVHQERVWVRVLSDRAAQEWALLYETPDGRACVVFVGRVQGAAAPSGAANGEPAILPDRQPSGEARR